MRPRLPWTAKDVFRLSPKDWIIYNSVIAFRRITGSWSYPVPCSGDFETMTRRDIIYWLYKSQYPVMKAWKNSGLEAHFEAQRSHRWELPAGFKPEAELTLSSVGDLMDHPWLPGSADELYVQVADLVFGADLPMANLECVVFPEGFKAFTIKTTEAPPLIYARENFDAVKEFRGRKFAFVAAANNHTLDCGEEGVASTIRELRRDGIAFHGVNETEADAHRATVFEKSGFRIGLISHTFGLNAKNPPKEKPWIVNRTHLNGCVRRGEVNLAAIEAQLRWCRENRIDAVVAHLHWGFEHEAYPRPDQLELARHLAELGVDVVIGHHPHMLQPMESYRTKRDPDRVVPIFYSLGNFVNPFSHPEFCRGGLARIALSRGVARDGSRRAYVRSAQLREVFQQIDENHGKIRMLPRRLDVQE